MKKIIMTLPIAISSLAAFATDDNVGKDVLNAFNKEFNGAKEVKWTIGAGFYRVAFVYNEQYISAFYNGKGELLALTRNISSVNLPLQLQAKLRSDYSDYWISDLFEVSNNDGTDYYITVEKGDSKLTLKSVDNAGWSVFRKTSKI